MEFKIRMQSSDSSEPSELRCVVSDSDWAVLLRFHEAAQQLRRTALVARGGGMRFHFEWHKGAGAKVETQVPDEDELAAFLHRLRPFVLKDEPTHFGKVANVIARSAEDPGLRRLITAMRDRYTGKRFSTMIRMTSNGVLLNSDETVMKWLNAYEYHRDVDKQNELAALHRLMPLESTRAIFVGMMIDKAHAVFGLDELIGFLNGEGTELRFHL